LGEELQDLKSQTEAVQTPVCLRKAQKLLLSSIEDGIKAAAISQTSLGGTMQKTYLDSLKQNLAEFYKQLERSH
jgi:hypothetical protein